MTWYEGSSLLNHLEEVHIASDRDMIDVRFPLQLVIRHQSTDGDDYRGYAGTVAGGILRPGDQVMALPSGFTSTIASIDTMKGPVDAAFPPMSVTVRLTDEIDLSPGDMLCRPQNRPIASQDIEAIVCWLDEQSELQPQRIYAIKHTTPPPGPRSRTCATASTSTRCTGRVASIGSRSTRSAG